MKKKLLQMTFGLWMICSGPMIAQNAIELEFYNCSNSPTSLCVTDPGVRLPDNNQSNLGQSDPNSSSCTVHFQHQVELRSSCSNFFQYMIEVSYDDTSAYEEILSWTAAFTDNQDEAILTFDTEQSTNDVVHLNGLPYTSGCYRYHRIRWTVMDLCSNTATCEKRFELYDCHAPVPISNQGPTILSFHSVYDVTANLDEIAGDYLDDCAGTNQFLFSTTNAAYQNDTVFHFCDVPVGVLYIIPIWVADQGRDLNCNGIISWDERTKYQVTAPVIFTADGTQDCSNPDVFVTGNIKTKPGYGIGRVELTVTDTEQTYPPVISDDNGHYVFPHYNFSFPVTLTAARDFDVKNGVSTLDLVKIQKHLLGIEPFTEYELFLAADANNSYALSAIDLVVLRKLILGLVDTLPIGKSWRFFSQDTTLPAYSESVTINSEYYIQHLNFDLLGIKLGDVNYTANPEFTSMKPRSFPPTLTWITKDRAYNTNDIVEIPVKSIADDILTGFQFTLSDPNLEFIGMAEGTIDVMSEDYALMGDQLTTSWFSISPIQVKAGDILFTIKAKAKAIGSLQNSLSLNSSITNAEVYDEHENLFTPQLEFQDSEQDHFIVYPNVPNPWKEETTVAFYLSEASNVKLNIYSVSGQIQYSFERHFEVGQHEIVLNKKDFTQHGLMLYSIRSNAQVKNGKMIVSE